MYSTSFIFFVSRVSQLAQLSLVVLLGPWQRVALSLNNQMPYLSRPRSESPLFAQVLGFFEGHVFLLNQIGKMQLVATASFFPVLSAFIFLFQPCCCCCCCCCCWFSTFHLIYMNLSSQAFRPVSLTSISPGGPMAPLWPGAQWTWATTDCRWKNPWNSSSDLSPRLVFCG